MSHSDTRSEREQWQRTLAAKCADPFFIAENLLCLLSGIGNRAVATRVSVALMRARATDRMTIRYQPDGGRAVYAKAYYDGDFGCLAYRWLRYLWENDFGPTSRERVPEPLGYVAQERMLVMRAASGFPVSDFIFAGSFEQAKRVMRTSALWLAKFHRQLVPDPQVESPCERMETLRTADLLAKVAAACPERTSLLIDLVHQWKEVALVTNLPSKLATVHGQFRPEHVFVQREAVVAIDLDKLTLSDPAKDVARFVHSMTKTCMSSAGDLSRIAALGEEFISAYDRYAPGHLANLRYYMSLFSLKELGKVWKNKKHGDADRAALGQMYLAGFQKWAQSYSWPTSAA
jgi:aminoglycoside phosphotransferase (APT) family kinase protein